MPKSKVRKKNGRSVSRKNPRRPTPKTLERRLDEMADTYSFLIEAEEELKRRDAEAAALSEKKENEDDE